MIVLIRLKYLFTMKKKIQELLANEGIIRNRLKVAAAVANGKAFLKVQEKYGSFDKFIWGYVNYTPIRNHWKKNGGYTSCNTAF